MRKPRRRIPALATLEAIPAKHRGPLFVCRCGDWADWMLRGDEPLCNAHYTEALKTH